MLASSVIPFSNTTVGVDASWICGLVGCCLGDSVSVCGAFHCTPHCLISFTWVWLTTISPTAMHCGLLYQRFPSHLHSHPVSLQLRSSFFPHLFSPSFCFSSSHCHCQLFLLLICTWTKTLKPQLLLRYVRVNSLKCLRLNQKWGDVPFTRNFDFSLKFNFVLEC